MYAELRSTNGLKISPDQKFLTNTTPEFEKARAGTKKGWVAGKKQLVAELERAAKGPKSKIQIDLKTSIELRNHGIELPEDTDGSYSMLSTLILQVLNPSSFCLRYSKPTGYFRTTQ